MVASFVIGDLQQTHRLINMKFLCGKERGRKKKKHNPRGGGSGGAREVKSEMAGKVPCVSHCQLRGLVRHGVHAEPKKWRFRSYHCKDGSGACCCWPGCSSTC